MSTTRSRRLFIKKTLLTAFGLATVPSKILASPSIRNSSLFEGNNPPATHISDLRIFPPSDKQITVRGCVYDKTGERPLANASIELWHLSPNSNKFNHRAKLTSNENGEYLLKTDFPNKEEGKITRIYFKVSHGSHSYYTELLVSDFGANITGDHWEKNKQLEMKLFPQKTGKINASTVIFNLSI